MKNLFTCKWLFVVVFIATGISLSAQSVSGTVIDGNTGEALPGVNVIVKGTTIGTVTDLDGNYTIEANSGDILVFSFVGFKNFESNVDNGQYNVSIVEDATRLNDVVVTATRQPVRKIRTTTAITTVSKQELAALQPESIAEALASTPGVTVENSQGRKSNYNIRGFPGGNTYVTTLYEGLPLNGFSARSAGTNEFIALDRTIERVEVVRGSGATLFGRAAGAGAVNLISKSGGDKLTGGVQFTAFNSVVGNDLPTGGNFDYRVDWNVSGPLTDRIKFSLGGYLMEDAGYKEWATQDQGGQISANLDFDISSRWKLRVYTIFGNNQFNNLTDSPFDLGTRELAEGWSNNNTFYPDNTQLNFQSELRTSVFAPIQFTAPLLDTDGNPIIQNQAFDNREEVEGGLYGLTSTFDLGKGWSYEFKLRGTSYNWRDQNEISLNSFYTAQSNILRLNANSVGDISDLITETRINYVTGGPNAKHSFSFGSFISNAEYDRFGGLHFYTSNVNPRPTYGFFGPPGTPPPTRFQLSTTTSHQEENTLAFFIGDEISIKDKLNINVGVRWDRQSGSFSTDPEPIQQIDFTPANFDPEIDADTLSFSDFSYSVGLNYLVAPRTAIYGSYISAFSLPTISALVSEDEREVLEGDNERVNNVELGIRFGIGDLGVDLGAFNTVINNRVATVFNPNAAIGQTFIRERVGENIVRGVELQLTFAPTAIKGLLLRGSLTLQNSEFGQGLEIPLDLIDDDGDPATPSVPEVDVNGNLFGLDLITNDAAEQRFAIDVEGNRVQNTPSSIISLNASYNTGGFGIGFDYVNYRGRFATALNLYETPNLDIANAHISYRFGVANGKGLRIGLRIKNLFNGADPQQLVLGSTNDNVLVQRQRTENFDGVLGFGIIQIPRRLLFSAAYDF